MKHRLLAVLAAMYAVLVITPSVQAEETQYVLSAIDFVVVEERSRPDALLLVSRLELGSEYSDVESLEAELENGRQLLLNRRVFDGIEVAWEIIDDAPAADGFTPVCATYTVDDGWTVLPIPFYRYNSNSGHNPFGVLYWNNIAGTLTDFGMSVGYYSRNWRDPFGWDVRLDWRKIRALGREWTFSVDQVFKTREQASPEGEIEFAYTGYQSRVGVSTGFRLTDTLGYSVSPRIDADYGYDTTVENSEESAPESRVGVGFGHSIGAGRVDWHGNLRSGSSWDVSNAVSFDVRDADVAASVGAGYRLFWIPDSHPRINPGFRVSVTHNFSGDSLGQGSNVRGVADNRVFGQTGLFVRTETRLWVLDIERAFDLHLNPFLDAAVVRKEGQPLSGDDFSAGAGFDLVIFPDFIRGFQGRLSFGVDLRDPPEPWYAFSNVEFFVVETLSF